MSPDPSNNMTKTSVNVTYPAHKRKMRNPTPARSMLHGSRSRSNVVHRIANYVSVTKHMYRMPNPDCETNAIRGANNADMTPAKSSRYIRLKVSCCCRSNSNIVSPPPSYLTYGGRVTTNPIKSAVNVGTEQDMSRCGCPISTNACRNVNTVTVPQGSPMSYSAPSGKPAHTPTRRTLILHLTIK